MLVLQRLRCLADLQWIVAADQFATFPVGVGPCADLMIKPACMRYYSGYLVVQRSPVRVASMQSGTVQAPAEQRQSLLERWDRSLSLAAYNKLGTRLPRSFYLLFEHGGNGLFWIPGLVPDVSSISLPDAPTSGCSSPGRQKAPHTHHTTAAVQQRRRHRGLGGAVAQPGRAHVRREPAPRLCAGPHYGRHHQGAGAARAAGVQQRRRLRAGGVRRQVLLPQRPLLPVCQPQPITLIYLPTNNPCKSMLHILWHCAGS